MRRDIVALTSTTAMLLATVATTAWGAEGSADPHASHVVSAQADERVVMRDVNGERIGVVTMRQRDGFVRVKATPATLTPGFHGFHVHDVGLCDADAPNGPFTTAGGHYTGGSPVHGDHAGDMPSLLAKDSGTARLSMRTDRFTLEELREGDGAAVMIHAGKDNFANIPERYSSGGVSGPDQTTKDTGDAGARIACGVIG